MTIQPALPIEGATDVLVKVFNRDGMWGFVLRFTDAHGRPLEGLAFGPVG